MEMKVSTGFPLRRCSWSYRPIVSATLTRRIIRWLDLVCVRPRQVQGISQTILSTATETLGNSGPEASS
jgi:hypothetical protein